MVNIRETVTVTVLSDGQNWKIYFRNRNILIKIEPTLYHIKNSIFSMILDNLFLLDTSCTWQSTWQTYLYSVLISILFLLNLSNKKMLLSIRYGVGSKKFLFKILKYYKLSTLIFFSFCDYISFQFKVISGLTFSRPSSIENYD